MQTLALIVNSFIVGLGHVITDRHLVGLFHFVAFAIFVDGIIVSRAIWTGPEADLLFAFSIAGAVLMWAYSMSSLVYRLIFFDEAHRRREVERHYVQGLRAFFQDRLADARSEFRECLALDPKNLTPRLMTAIAYREEHNFNRAYRLLKESEQMDRDGTWQFEIEEALNSIEIKRRDVQSERALRKTTRWKRDRTTTMIRKK